ncbi:MAG TPA: Gfo/Idh/MocA family oxidoreductase [Gemmatimonadaceae bacterium]|nr:Gfo/Idh/MocA family oxidoreductase [Gemmatimonadaceae bacterium]
MAADRIAIIGLGEAGYEIHLPALSGIKGVTVVGACAEDPIHRARAEQKFNVPLFTDLDSMLAVGRPDVLIVATPPDTHASLCLKAIEAGIDVICEKPFVSTLDEADSVIDAARLTGRRVALNHEFREMPIFRSVLEHAGPESGEAVFFAQAWQNIYLPPGSESGWRRQMQRRTLHEAGVHLVDYLLALFGEKPIAVWASMLDGGTLDGGADALTVVALEFSDGRLAQLVQNRLSKGDTQYFEVRAESRNASYRASFGGRARLTLGLFRSTVPHLRFEYGASGIAWRETGKSRKILARNPKNPRVAATRYLLEKTLAAFRSGGPLPASAADGRAALEVIDACYSAAASGRRTPVRQDAPAASDGEAERPRAVLEQ